MAAKGLSKSAQAGYTAGAKELALFCKKPYQEIESDEIMAYLVSLREERGLSRNTMRIYSCGIKYMYRHVVKREGIVQEIPYPKKTNYIPEILTSSELKRLFDLTVNLKHRAFLKLVYSAGITKNVSLHSLRHCFASHLLSMGTDLLTVQRLLGHSSIRTTMVYLHLGQLPKKPPTSPLDIIYPRDYSPPCTSLSVGSCCTSCPRGS